MTFPLKLLLIEDNEDDSLLLLRHLRHQDFDVKSYRIETEQQLKKALEHTWDIIICDYSMPGFSGLQALHITQERHPDLPFIIISGQTDEETIVEIMKAGAHDCLLKNNLIRLVPAIKRELNEAKNKREKDTIAITLQNKKRQLQLKLVRANRALTALSACNEALFKAADEKELTTSICQIMTTAAKYQFAWVAYIDPSTKKSVHVHASASDGSSLLDKPNITLGSKPGAQDPIELAIRTKQHVIINDISNSDSNSAWLIKAGNSRFQSMISLPLIDKETTIGALNLYSKIAGAFTEEEIEMLTQVAENLAFGIIKLRVSAEKKLLQKQLQQAQKMQAIGQLTGGIAHDFNNILSSVLGFTELALTHPSVRHVKKVESYLTEVKAAGNRASDLISQLLLFSHGGHAIPSKVNISQTWQEIENMLSPLISKEATLSVDIQSPDFEVYIDPIQLQQVMMNLCLNALDAITNDGRISINISQEKVFNIECDSCYKTLNNHFINFTVTDNGSGIDASIVKNIFDPFFTTKDIGKGSGMGLSIVHGIVHEHNGHIRMQSHTNNGTSFAILLPCLD